VQLHMCWSWPSDQPWLTFEYPLIIAASGLYVPRASLRRFAACLSGRAFGLALAVRPAGLAEAPGSRVCACAASDAPEGSALDAGGASPDNARRSGPVPVTFRPAIGTPGA
jgi:hypothetical protein